MGSQTSLEQSGLNSVSVCFNAIKHMGIEEQGEDSLISLNRGHLSIERLEAAPAPWPACRGGVPPFEKSAKMGPAARARDEGASCAGARGVPPGSAVVKNVY